MAHAFLIAKEIALDDPSENEMFTDLAVVFVGFGKLLLNGLTITTHEHLSEGHVMGYLSPDLIVYCYKKVNEFRSIGEDVAKKNPISDVKEKIGNPDLG